MLCCKLVMINMGKLLGVSVCCLKVWRGLTVIVAGVDGFSPIVANHLIFASGNYKVTKNRPL